MALYPEMSSIFVGIKSGCIGTENMDSYVYDNTVEKTITIGDIDAYQFYKLGKFILSMPVTNLINKYDKYINRSSIAVSEALKAKYNLYAINKITSVEFYSKSTTGSPPVSTYKKLLGSKLKGVIPIDIYIAVINIFTGGLKTGVTLPDIIEEVGVKTFFNDIFSTLPNMAGQGFNYYCLSTYKLTDNLPQSNFSEGALVIAEYNNHIYTNLNSNKTDISTTENYFDFQTSGITVGTVLSEENPLLNYRAIINSNPLIMLF